MTATQSTIPSVFTVLVEDELDEQLASPDLAPGMSQDQSVRSWVRKKILRHEPLDLSKVQAELDRVQGEVDDLLGKLATEPKHGFGLSEVQVSVGVSAQGSIAVVTAGVQASLTLVYAQPKPTA